MNIKEIPVIIKNRFNDLLTFLKVIYKLPGAKKYFAVSIFLIVIFFFITFPYEELVKKKLNEGSGRTYSSARISGLDVGILGSTDIEKLEVYFTDLTEIIIEKAELGISVNPYRLLVSRRLLTDLDIQNFKYSGKENEFKGKVTGDIDVTIADKSNIPENGTISINITRGALQLGLINIPTSMGNIPLKTDIINITLLNFSSDIINRTAKIKKFALESEEISCSFTGTITLEPILKNSRLDMKMTLDPQSKIFDQHRDIVNAFAKNGPIIISIGGTAGRPEFKMDKNEN